MKEITEQINTLPIAYSDGGDGLGKVISIDSQHDLIKTMMDALNQKLTKGFDSPEEESAFFQASLPLHISLSAFMSRKCGDSHPHWISGLSAVHLSRPTLRWTGMKAEAVEIIYELVHVGVLNNGQATVMQVTKWFEQEFQIDLGNVSKVFQDIRNRKKETTSLALLMDKALRQYIEQLDEEEEEKSNHSKRA